MSRRWLTLELATLFAAAFGLGIGFACGSACKKDPGSGVIGVE